MNIRDIMATAIPAVEFMYDKVARIERYMEYRKPSGATGTDWVAVYPVVPCRLSNPNLSNTIQKEANLIEYDTKMFLSSTFEVLAGDKVFVSDGIGEVEYESANEPFRYVSHQEVLLQRKGYA